MKSKYFGLLFILAGFATPYVLHSIFPKFVFIFTVSTLFFWAGFLLLFHPLDNNHKFNPYLRWARYSILINAILTILHADILYFEIEGSLGHYIIRALRYLSNPIRSIFDEVVPPPMEQKEDGSVHITYTFSRLLLTTFFNLVFYSIAGIAARIIKEKKDHKALSIK
jgi:hypothetical protein